LSAVSIIPAVDGSTKERLTGALIFVAIVVIVVPEMFSGPAHRSPGVEMPVDPAGSVAPVRTYSMPVDGADRAVTTAPVSAPVPEPSVVAQNAEAQLEAAPAVVTEPEAAPASVIPSAAPPAASAVAPVSTPTPTPAAAKPVPERAPVTGSWWTQVGIFSSRENADRLAKRLRTDGFDIEVSQYTAGGKDMFRVRAGPVPDRAAAGQAALLVAP
jgi:DedD protein